MINLFILQAGGGSAISALLPMVLMLVVVFFFFIRPQVKKQKEQARFIESLDKGEEVVTNAGIIGRINKIDGSIVTLAISEKTFIRITKGSISKEMTEAYRKAGIAGDTSTQ